MSDKLTDWHTLKSKVYFGTSQKNIKKDNLFAICTSGRKLRSHTQVAIINILKIFISSFTEKYTVYLSVIMQNIYNVFNNLLPDFVTWSANFPIYFKFKQRKIFFNLDFFHHFVDLGELIQKILCLKSCCFLNISLTYVYYSIF